MWKYNVKYRSAIWFVRYAEECSLFFSLYPFDYLSVFLSIYLSLLFYIYLFLCMSFFLPICLYFFLSMSFFLSFLTLFRAKSSWGFTRTLVQESRINCNEKFHAISCQAVHGICNMHTSSLAHSKNATTSSS